MSRSRRAAAIASIAAGFLAVAADAATLDCDHVESPAVRAALAHLPAPRVILIAGSLPSVTLDSFARFLIGMGYPADRIADPFDGRLSRSGYADAVALAGEVAWDVEHDGMPPMLIGHSRGGMLVMRTLHELAGAFGAAIPVWDPTRRVALPRTTYVDPASGTSKPVVGIAVDYAVAIATGKLPRVWQGQWDMLPLLRRVPDTAREFTGFHIDGDLIAGDVLGIDPYETEHAARVRNVVLPASYTHIGAVELEPLAADASTREFIRAWHPGSAAPPPAGASTRNLGLATEVWYGVKRAWCRAAQRRAG